MVLLAFFSSWGMFDEFDDGDGGDGNDGHHGGHQLSQCDHQLSQTMQTKKNRNKGCLDSSIVYTKPSFLSNTFHKKDV